MFNVSNDNMLTFKQFTRFMYHISNMSSESPPPLSVLRDLFSNMDKNTDHYICLTEWVQMFKKTRCTFRPNTKAINEWEDSSNFDAMTHLIARNRKLILRSCKKVM